MAAIHGFLIFLFLFYLANKSSKPWIFLSKASFVDVHQQDDLRKCVVSSFFMKSRSTLYIGQQKIQNCRSPNLSQEYILTPVYKSFHENLCGTITRRLLYNTHTIHMKLYFLDEYFFYS